MSGDNSGCSNFQDSEKENSGRIFQCEKCEHGLFETPKTAIRKGYTEEYLHEVVDILKKLP